MIFFLFLSFNDSSDHDGGEGSPGGDAEQEMSQLGDVLWVRTVAVKEMTLLDQLPEFSSAAAVVVSWGKLNEFVADGRPWDYNDGDLVFNA